VPLGEVGQEPSSHALYLNEFGKVSHRQDCPEILIKPMRPIELKESPQEADPCSICNPPAAHVQEAGAQASTSEQQSSAKEHSSLFASSSTELNSGQPEQVAQAPVQPEQVAQAPAQPEQMAKAPLLPEQVEQAPAPLKCPSCARRISANDSFCFFCGKKLRV